MKLRKAISTNPLQLMLMHWCPGCKQPHGIRVEGPGPKWSFNGDYENPHFEPSIRCFTTKDGVQQTLCHYFIHNGKIDFCGDCPHEFNGKQGVEIPDWPYARGAYGGIEEPEMGT